jgi:hypothetical protein
MKDASIDPATHAGELESAPLERPENKEEAAGASAGAGSAVGAVGLGAAAASGAVAGLPAGPLGAGTGAVLSAAIGGGIWRCRRHGRRISGRRRASGSLPARR